MLRLLTTIFLLLTMTVFVNSQEQRIICGTLKDNSGEPLIGVTISVKGTNIGTVTDINGKYCIHAPLGSTLLFSFIGFSNKELIVTLKNSKVLNALKDNIKQKSTYTPIVSDVVQTDTLDEGTAYFTAETPSFKIQNPNSNWFNPNFSDPTKIRGIEFGRNTVKIILQNSENVKIPHITFSSSLSLDQYNRLPEVQKEFSQGIPLNGTLQWQGPETGVIFSWGPPTRIKLSV